MQKTLMLVIFLLQYYQNDAFIIRSFLYNKNYNKKNGHLLQLNNDENNSDLEIDTISKSINKIAKRRCTSSG
jgi:hypothetical protein